MESMTRHPVILLRGLRKTYATDAGEVQAVKGVDLTVNAGDFVAIMGSSGSGKSTMMNILGCLDQASEGTYHLDGVDTSHLDSDELAELRNRKLGFVFQGFNLLSRTTALENVELPLIYSPRRLSPEERDDDAIAELERVGLGQRLDHHPNELSGGQQQRVAIARSLVNRPAVLLADEPTGNLDSATSDEIMKLFKSLNESGITIIMVTHEPDVAAHARRTVVMKDGVIRSDERRLPEAVVPEAAPVEEKGGSNLMAGTYLALNILSTSGRALLRNKLRTVLTALGIIIGVAAVIAMVAIGRGASAMIEAQFRSLGSNMLLVFSGQVFKGGVYRGFGGAGTLTVEDAEAIATEIPGVVAVSPEIRSNERLIAEGKNYSSPVRGASPAFFQVRDWALSSGAIFGEEEVRSMATVALLGQTVVDRMFPEGSPVGRTLRIGDVPFQVIGVLAKKGAAPWGEEQDDVVIIPYTTAMKQIVGTTRLRSINIKVGSAPEMATAQEQTNLLLRERHNIPDPSLDDFSVRTQDEFIKMATANTKIMTILLGSIAGVSLLVGGIGIMNIMLVSVTERTREIGIRRAVGAKGRDIRLQFIVEAIVLSTVGGAIGIGLGIGTAQLLTHYAGWPALVSGSSVAISFGVSFAVGVVFGFFPAHKAAKLNPIEALRHE
ncbi:MAG: transporter related [Verrucomicrobiales bacterium]|nr:transporter related [Verrucomicrobiales bacterium]